MVLLYSITASTSRARRRQIIPVFRGIRVIPMSRLVDFLHAVLYWAPRFGLAFDIFGTTNTVLTRWVGSFLFPHSTVHCRPRCFRGCAERDHQRREYFHRTRGLERSGRSSWCPGRRSDERSDSLFRQLQLHDLAANTFRGLLEVSYVGNQSKNLLNNGYAGSAINAVPAGALFQPGLDPNNANIDQFRPLQGFQDVNIITHGLYQNYNSLQLSWTRTSGRYNMMFNYTYGKSMGIVGNYDVFNLDNNYGVLPFDRRHIFNAAYSIEWVVR